MKRTDGSWQEDIQCIVEPSQGKGAIFISNLEAAQNPRTLAKLNIGAVITACKGQNMATTMPKHIQYLYLPAIDHESFDLSQYFDTAHELLAEQTRRTNVLVHCMAGVSRSATLVIAHLMASRQLSFQRAYQWVKSKRKIISPNPSFIKQLQAYEATLASGSKKQMDQSTSSSWYSKSPRKARCQQQQDYDRKLRDQIKTLMKGRAALSK